MTSPPNALMRRWTRWSAWPGGAWLFSIALGRQVRYTGSIRGRVLEIAPGRARVAMTDRAAVRNHLGSIHAIALVNLGELASGLAMLAAIPDTARGIVTSIAVDYVKKARGPLVATGTSPIPSWTEPAEHDTVAEIAHAQGDVVARVRARWLIGPKE